MKIEVDAAICQGHTLCAMTAPGLFRLRDEDGHSEPAHDEVPAGSEDLAADAIRTCPEQAIRSI